ncbi:MAG: F0F1 ATP synthase subunit B [Opitutales bacterium]|nr:F0F1 ATP synthase subunit B [Opitutales bacterium]
MLSFSILALAETVDAENVNKISELADRFGLLTSSFLAQIVNFAIVAYVLYRFLVKPVLATMDERQQKIADGLQFAEEAKLRLAESEKKQAQVIQEAQAEAQRILKEARITAEKHEERMRAETARQIEEMRRRADEANELERKRILGEVRGEVARLVVLTTGKVLRKELSDKDKDTLNTAAAREIGSLN